MKENLNYIRKRKPIDFTMNDLQEESDDDDFVSNAKPSASRALPNRNSKPKNFHESDNENQDDTEEDESELENSSGSSMNKTNENKIQNSIELAKNLPCDKRNNCDDSTDWNPTGDPNYNPYLEDEHESWNRYCSSSESD